MRTTAGDVKKGDFIKHQDDIWQVVKTTFNFQGRGMATVRIKVKSVSSGKNVELGFKSTDQLDQADVSTARMQYLYREQDELYFMDEAYNQHSLNAGIVGDIANFLKEGEQYFVLLYNEKPISMRPPASVKLKIIETEDAVKGDTVSGAKKSAKVETGVTVMVPLFIKQGEMIVVNPETGEYVERVKS